MPTDEPFRPVFEPGQCWKYRTRPSEPDSRLTIVQVDADTVHVHVRGIRLLTQSGSHVTSLFLPIALPSLSRSVVELEQVRDDNFDALHEEWITSNDTRDRGHFTIELDRFLSMFDRTVHIRDESDDSLPS